MLGSLTLAVLVATRTVAVVDLSSPKAPAIADALRKTPALKPVAMSTAKTNAAVSDAESLGIICSVDDGQCLEKLQVLLHADEMVAFSSAGSALDVVRLGRGSARRAHLRISGSASATAAAAWDALQHDTGDAAKPKDPAPPPPPPPKEDASPPKDTTPATAPTKDDPGPKALPPKLDATPTATSGGVSPALAVTIIGAVVGVGCGTGAVVTSADLANKLEAAKSGQKALDQKAYDNGSALFWVLTACTVAGVGGAAAGGVLTVVE